MSRSHAQWLMARTGNWVKLRSHDGYTRRGQYLKDRSTLAPTLLRRGRYYRNEGYLSSLVGVPYLANPVMKLVRERWNYDEKRRSALVNLDAVCDALYVVSPTLVPEEVGYEPGGYGRLEEFPHELWELLKGGQIDHMDLVRAARTLNRYVDVLDGKVALHWKFNRSH